MPRLDVLRALGHPHSYASGFWGMATIAPSAGDAVELALRAELDGGGVATAELGRIAVRELPAPSTIATPAPEAGPLVAICMATYEPPLDLFERQLESIRGQTHRNWVCVVSDDCSAPERFAAIEAAIDGDPRFVVSRSPERLGFYRNFQRALAMAPA